MIIEVKMKTDKKLTIDFLEFGEGKNCIKLDWDESQFSQGYVHGKGVYFNEEYANGRMREIEGMELTALQVYDRETQTELDWVEIESIYFSDDEERYEVPEWLLKRFRRHDIHLAGLDLELTEKQYGELEKYIRQKDKEGCLMGALDNDLDDVKYENVYQYLKREMENDPQNMTDDFNPDEYSGEEEIKAINDVIENRGGMAVYRMISNKGTIDECEMEVLLMKKQAEIWMDNIRERDNGTGMQLQEKSIILTGTEGENIDLFYVDEIILKNNEYL